MDQEKSSRKLKGNFKLTKSAIDLIRNIETYQSESNAASNLERDADQISLDDGYNMNRMLD